MVYRPNVYGRNVQFIETFSYSPFFSIPDSSEYLISDTIRTFVRGILEGDPGGETTAPPSMKKPTDD